MIISKTTVTIKELIDGYSDNQDKGIVALGGRLDVRPPFQREFVYKDKQREAVLQTVLKGFPLNTIYWSKRVAADGTSSFEVLDGQQRILSICQYATNAFSVRWKGNARFRHNLTSTPEMVKAFEDYELDVYVCEGSAEEQLEWFETINIAGMVLKPQELRNAAYVGPWLADAKRYFSRFSGPAHLGFKDYLRGDPDRQDYLETVIRWAAHAGNVASKGTDDDIKVYMASHQNNADATHLWNYFKKVMAWVKATFPDYRSEMDGLEWGLFYNKYSDSITAKQSSQFEAEVVRLLEDEDVTSNKGIYLYLLSGDERSLSIRAFSPQQRRLAFTRQKGVCPVCEKVFDIKEMEADHITPWSKGGPTIASNCQMLCKDDNRKKSGV
ncbi:DUF262 domain-containing protein [Frigoribacterium sp. PvP032]|uniref:HNH endonuclease family protein n=1 Tax=Frigoribacterium sp. PvP032 TaxID=2806589 RepID=UPI001AE4A4E9|nr:DUF262 domain-containing protein [Frigoribacterium sp. PvP032]MBP1191098.1 hypothetical protein [Frigoribacterium sp. PvP032]